MSLSPPVASTGGFLWQESAAQACAADLDVNVAVGLTLALHRRSQALRPLSAGPVSTLARIGANAGSDHGEWCSLSLLEDLVAKSPNERIFSMRAHRSLRNVVLPPFFALV